jgi:hypothetical protein
VARQLEEPFPFLPYINPRDLSRAAHQGSYCARQTHDLAAFDIVTGRLR